MRFVKVFSLGNEKQEKATENKKSSKTIRFKGSRHHIEQTLNSFAGTKSKKKIESFHHLKKNKTGRILRLPKADNLLFLYNN